MASTRRLRDPDDNAVGAIAGDPDVEDADVDVVVMQVPLVRRSTGAADQITRLISGQRDAAPRTKLSCQACSASALHS